MDRRNRVRFIFLVIWILASCSAYNAREIDENVSVGTHSLHIRCLGQGKRTVVIDTGLGDTLERWGSIQSQAAHFAHVCTYDRAGYGLSEPGPIPRHSLQIASELRLLLENAGIRGPYLLVGHSLGGVTMQVFADRYPDQTAGLILLDPSPLDFITGQAFPDLYQMLEKQTVEFRQMAETASQSDDPAARGQASYLAAIASEHAALTAESAAQASAIESFGDLPMIVIASGQPNPAFGEDAEAFQEFWIEQNRELASKSSNGRFVLAAESGHNLHEEASEDVIEAIFELAQK